MADAVDLNGDPRIVNAIADMGCYEREASASLECAIATSLAAGLDHADATLSATVVGDTTGEIDFSPYSTLADAALSIDDAFPLLGTGGTRYIDDGTYTVTRQIEVFPGNGTEIVSLNGPDKTAVTMSNAEYFKSVGYYMLKVTAPDSYIEGITFAGGKKASPSCGCRGLVYVSGQCAAPQRHRHGLLFTVCQCAVNIVNQSKSTVIIDHSITDDETDPELKPDRAPRMSSPAIDAGDWAHLGATDADVRKMTDLLGNPRMRGGAIDIGCFELFAKGTLILME